MTSCKNRDKENYEEWSTFVATPSHDFNDGDPKFRGDICTYQGIHRIPDPEFKKTPTIELLFQTGQYAGDYGIVDSHYMFLRRILDAEVAQGTSNTAAEASGKATTNISDADFSASPQTTPAPTTPSQTTTAPDAGGDEESDDADIDDTSKSRVEKAFKELEMYKKNSRAKNAQSSKNKQK
jgi:hypothetical protein